MEEAAEELTIQRSKISINTKKKAKQKRSLKHDARSPTKRPNLTPNCEGKHSLNDVTLIHRSDGLVKDERVSQNKLNMNVSNGPNYACHFCQNSFFSGLKLKMHFLMEHQVLYCKICDILLESDEERGEHEARVHSGKVCEICQENVNGDVVAHYTEAHDALICRYCDVLLHPRGHYGKHLVEKHCVTENFVRNDELDDIIEKNARGCSFFCRLCEKSRYRELFGHFSYYHKVNTYYLAGIFTRQKIELKLNIVSEVDEIKSKVASQKSTKYNYCKTCMGIYTRNVPKAFHKVYCENRRCCPLCHKVFEKIDSLDRHLNEEHATFPCKLNCTEMECNSLEDLEDHYSSEHSVTMCELCDDLVPDKNSHVSEIHNTLKPAENVFALLKSENCETKCALCDTSMTNVLENAKDILVHYKNDHSMSTVKIMRLIGPKPKKKQSESERSGSETDSDLSQEPKLDDDEFRTDFDPKFVKCHFDLNSMRRSTGETLCEFCETKFPSDLKLVCHLYDRHGFKVVDKILDCLNCSANDRNFLLDVHMEHYIESEYAKMETYDCKKCYFAMSVEDARVHILEKHKEELESFNLEDCGLRCRFCERLCWEEDEMERHELEEHFNDNKKDFLECNSCCNNFCSIRSLIDHNTPIKCQSETYQSISFQCTVCTVMFPTVRILRDHFKETHPKLTIVFCPEEDCKKTFALKKYAKQHHHNLHEKRNGLPTNYECEICGRTFTNKKSYLLHTKNSHAKGFKCVICGDKFQTAEHRKHHYSTVHPGELLYECADCQKTFLSKSGLHVHNKLHNEFSSVCSYCGKEFFRRDSYKEHLLIHIGPKHQCTYCPKVFTQKSNLRRHIRLHTGEKPYNCPHCTKKFSDKGACNSHITVHTRDQECYCEVCGKKFSKQQKLKYHMKRHTGEGLVRCDICHRGFTSQYDLRKHLLTHDQQTQIICQCGRGFSSEKYLRTHIKVVHDPNKPTQSIKKRGSKFNCFQCLICKNIYSLRTTVLKHLRNIHKLDKKAYVKNMRRLEPEEEALFTQTVLEQQVTISGRVEVHATIQRKEDEGISDASGSTDVAEPHNPIDLVSFTTNPLAPTEVVPSLKNHEGTDVIVPHSSAEGTPKKPRNRKHKNPSKYCGREVDKELMC